MAILWFGGEDFDFPNGANHNPGDYSGHRTGWARSSINKVFDSSLAKSSLFQGGAVTSAWMSSQFINWNGYAASQGILGFGLSTGGDSGIFVGTGATAPSTGPAQIAIVKFDGTTWTVLASESGTSLAAFAFQKIDLQVINAGASATVNVYLAGTLLVTYTGNIGISSFDSVYAYINQIACSEIVAADSDTRNLGGLVTLTVTGDGTTAAWSGSYTGVNGTNYNGLAYSDGSPVSSTGAQDEQFTVSSIPSGTWIVSGLKTIVRAKSTGGTLQLGYASAGGSPSFGGSAQAPGGSFGPLERWDFTNPITGSAWTQADLTGLQLTLRASASGVSVSKVVAYAVLFKVINPQLQVWIIT